MSLAFRLLIVGIIAVPIGLWWSIDGMAGGFMNEALGGLIWKGPLLLVTGVGAAVMGVRMLQDIKGPQDSSSTASSVDTEMPDQAGR